MLYRLLANLVVVVHGLFIVFVVAGGFLAWRWRWVAWLHVPTAVWGVLIEYRGWMCPLTPLENHFRLKAGLEGYSGGFIEHYLLPLIYPTTLTPAKQFALGTFVLLTNLCAYGILVRRALKGS